MGWVTVDEQLLRDIQDAMLDPHLLLGPEPTSSTSELRIIEANPAACAYLGFEPDDLVGQIPSSVISPAAAELLASWCRGVLESGRPITIDDQPLPSPLAEGSGWFDVRAVKVADSVSLTWRDVSDRHAAMEELARSEARYRMLADNATDVILQSSSGGIVEWASPSITSTLGWTTEEVVGRHIAALLHPDDFTRLRATQQEMIKAGRLEGRMEARYAMADGTWRWMSDHGRALVDLDGNVVGGIDSLRDIQAEHEARIALVESEARFRMAMDSAPSGMALVGLDRRFIEVNGALTTMLGRSADWLNGRPITDVIHPDDVESDLDMRREAHQTPTASATREKRLVQGSGAVMWVQHSIALVRDDDEPTYYVSQFLDITQAREARGNLEFIADHDHLTGLPNRRAVLKSMSTALAHAPRGGSPLLVLFCDLDELKPVNDTLGHSVGDQLLTEIGKRMRGALRADDIVGRVGGDEFVALLSSVGTIEDAEGIVRKLRAAISTPGPVAGAVPRISIGLTLADAGEDPEQVLRRADRALYRAKAAGGDRTAVYDPELDEGDRTGQN
jgi:diguanylate cyclase (GGDEF)-like protein/PAS domain S-box-containing protein